MNRSGSESHLPTPEALVASLAAYDVPFLRGETDSSPASLLPPAALPAGLARREEARLRVALILTLLVHPELSGAVAQLAPCLRDHARRHLKLYYSAAVSLQREVSAEPEPFLGPQPALPPLFHDALGSPQDLLNAEILGRIGAQHRQITGLPAAWSSSYRQAAHRLLRRLHRDREWQRQTG